MIIAAAGNGAREELDFPARFRGIIAIGSVDSAKARSRFSNYGATAADGSAHDSLFFLPGGQDALSGGSAEYVGTTIIPSKNWKGTSFSAAYASGAIALMLSSAMPSPSRASVLAHIRAFSSTAIAHYASSDHGEGLMIVKPMP